MLRRLGAGGMSEVYLAYDPDLHCQVAVKVLPEELAKSATYVGRFRREAEVGQKIHHPNVVRCLEAGTDTKTGQRFLVMEYVKGRSAQAMLDEQGPLSLKDATRIILDIARALEELHHRGYVHRDVKPGNILVDEEGRAKLADLGVAKPLADAAELTSFDQGVGTPYYMPWEQMLNASLVDARSDLFALGATYYHLVAGQVPFPGKDVTEVSRLKDEGDFQPIREIDPSLPRSVDTILSKLLARMPKDRFQSAAQLIDVLTASGLTDDESAGPPAAETAMPQQATRPEITHEPKRRKSIAPAVWTVQYQHEGVWKRSKARLDDILRMYEEGTLPDSFFLARAGQKTCRHFRSFVEFRDLRRRTTGAPATPSYKKNRCGWLVLGAVVAVLVTAIASLVLHLVWS
ncbi:MAG TPA: serine/threonine-protein kinase [Gemmataceae bacterium]|jgi:serine/threonine protein kinase|nr:serine/threonine-protein kinase [Gemmataceae bacterium]